MLLKVAHRFMLLNILPQVGDFATLRIVRDLQAELSFTEQELKSKGVTRNGNDFQWVAESDVPKDVHIGEAASQVIRSRLETLDKKKELQAVHLPLYEHFILGSEWEV